MAHASPWIEDPQRAAERALAWIWQALGGRDRELESMRLLAHRRALTSVYDVTAFASGIVAAATLALTRFSAVRSGGAPRQSEVVSDHVAAAFACERLIQPVGWTLPPAWDPLAGDYRAADGFVRLHTNYEHHRRAALEALQVAPERERVACAVASLPAEQVEASVVAAGGCAAALRSDAQWAEHPAGLAVAQEPLVAFTQAGWGAVAGAHESVAGRAEPAAGNGDHDPLRPLSGLRVLDLTRVIAGPVATRFLAAYGADVLRIDPPGFAEVPALLPETTAGKRCTSLDLRAPQDRARFEALVAEADVLVSGLRSNSLSRLGYGADALHALRPGLLIARLDAYGWTGPWCERRGFDSLVQMSAGIADLGMRAAGASTPVPLPVQALDHGTGYLLAAAVLRGLTEPLAGARPRELRVSLARTAHLLRALGTSPTLAGESLTADDSAAFLEDAPTAWGPVRRVRCPGTIEGAPARWTEPAGSLGTAEPTWSRLTSHPAA